MGRLCPHCNVVSNFSHQTTTSGQWGRSPAKFPVQVLIETCQHCGGVIVNFKKQNDNTWKEFISFPVTMPVTDASIPQNVAEDFISAVNCTSIKEYKAAATMFRRALQQVMIDKQTKDAPLWQQIDDLAAKSVITSDLKDWAHEIRLWGNEGAHPSKDGLNTISEVEIEDVRKFLESLLDYVYVMPSRVATSRASRAARKASGMP